MSKKEKPVKPVKEKNILPGTIIFGLIAAIIIYALMINTEKNALADFEKGSIYIATGEIPKGTLIQEDNFVTYFELKELDKDLIPKTAINTPEQINNLVVCSAIDEGTLLTLGMFESVNELTQGMQEPVIAGFKAEDLYQVVGGTLRAGDRIHIYNVDEEGEVSLDWSDVYVQEVFDNVGTKIGNDDEETSAQRVNIYMDKADIEEFYAKLAKGSLRVVKVWE
uniref:hypothetical protein n=1 Tax=Acetatifactor sp. TaxID=1872090 RepID=UPI00405765FD